MSSGFEISGEEGKKAVSAKGFAPKKKYFSFLMRPLSVFILITCLIVIIISIAFFPKPLKPISSIKVNFQDSLTDPPKGWIKDFGQAYGPRTSSDQGDGYVYGWIKRSDKTPLDLAKNGVKRNFPSDILSATFLQMQGNTVSNFNGTAVEGIWEAQVVDGNYDVTVSVGDGASTDSKNVINVEGVSAIAGFVPDAHNKFKSATVTISVSDGYLTVDAIGGTNTKINSIVIHPSHSKRPSIIGTDPDNNSVNVGENTAVSTNVVMLPNGSINSATVTASSVFLTEEETGAAVPSHVNGNKAGDTITLVPDSPLKLSTAYKFTITSAVKDTADSSFIPYSSTFTTAHGSTGTLAAAKFDKIDMPNAAGQYSSLTIGPDGKLYALSIDGIIKRFPVNPDGTLASPEIIYSLQDAYGARKPRISIGFTFDPSSTASNLIAWITHSTFMFQNGPDWDGRLSRLSGPALNKVEDVLINLPRSAKDHLTNSIAFGPDGALYFTQGSNTAMGSADKTWASREEHLLSGAVLRLDVTKLHTLPLNVKTDNGGNYNPYAPNAPLTIYASGLRNAYDLLWHSNGSLYVPTNGSAAGGNTPASERGVLRPDGTLYNGPSVPALYDVKQVEKDFLFRVVKGGYYGHPNASRGEFVMNGGNPTPGADPAEQTYYPAGTLPDANWRGFAYDFHNNASPDGIIEYKSNTFNGALKGRLLVVRYSHHDDIITLTPGGQNNDIVSATEGYSIKGFSGFVDPLDITEDTRNGNLYVSEFSGQGKITLLRPATNKDAITYNKPHRKRSL